MKKLWIFYIALCAVGWVCADTTIDPSHPYAYGANIGWLTARADGTNGAAIGQAYCTGYVWSADCGWICLGNGPTNGWQYSNLSSNDWGVNHDGEGNLSGYAYGANIGWINFEQTYGQPQIDLLTGNLDGYVWGANVGWIGLSNTYAYVRTDTLAAGPDSDGDGIPDPWEYRMAGNLGTLSDGGRDVDNDGVPDAQEYPADTDPTDIGDLLAMTDIRRQSDTNRLTWTIRQTRFYELQQATALTGSVVWTDSGLGQVSPDPGPSMTREIVDTSATTRFYRVQASIPLSE